MKRASTPPSPSPWARNFTTGSTIERKFHPTPVTADRQELEMAYQKYGATVLRRAVRLLGSDEAAWEAVHQVFLSLLERPEQFQKRSSMLTFLYEATTHHCLNQLRNHKTRMRLLETKAHPEGGSAGLGPD